MISNCLNLLVFFKNRIADQKEYKIFRKIITIKNYLVYWFLWIFKRISYKNRRGERGGGLDRID
jgi:hypothetical protein